MKESLIWRLGCWWVKRCAEERKKEFAKLNGFVRDSATESLCRELQTKKLRIIWIVPALFLGGIAVGVFFPEIDALIPIGMVFGGLAFGVGVASWSFVRCPHCGRRMRRLYLLTRLTDGEDLWYICDKCKTCAFSGESRGG